MDEGWFAPSYALFSASAGETLILLLQSKKKLRTDSLFYWRPGNSGASGSDGETWWLFSVRRGGQSGGRKFTEKRTAFRRNACYKLLQKHRVSLQDANAGALIFLPTRPSAGTQQRKRNTCAVFLHLFFSAPPLCWIYTPCFCPNEREACLQKPGGLPVSSHRSSRWSE